MALQLRRGTNAERLMITPQQGELIFVTDYLAVNITGTTIATNVITFSANHGITVLNTKLLYQGVTQNGLTQGTVYYVKSIPAVNQLTLSTTSGGTTLALTNGTGLTLTFNKTPTNASGTPVGNVSPLWIGNGTTVGGVSAQVSVLDDLLDVTLASLEEGDTLYYDATTGQWKNTHIFKIIDNVPAIDVNSTVNNRISMNTSITNAPSAPLVLRHTSSGAPTAGFGTTLGFEAETTGSGVKTIGYLDYQVIDTTTGSEDYQFGIGLMRGGVEPSPTLLRPLIVDSDGHTQITGNLTLNREQESGTDTYITFGNPTKNGVLAWNSGGTGLFINGNFDVAGTGANGQVDITAGSGLNTGIANIFNNTIGTVNIGNGVTTELNLGNATAGTRTQVKSPNLDLLGDIKIGGNDIKSSTGATAITLSGTDVTIANDLQVTGNTIKGSTGSVALEISSSDVEVRGDLTVTGNDIKSSTGNTAITLSGNDVIVVGDLQVNGANGGVWADITTTKTQATLFPANATTVNLAGAATALGLGASTGLTTVNNDLAVIGGDITTSSYTANIYNNDGIGVVNIGNGATSQVNIGNNATGTVNIKSTSLLQNDLAGVSKTFNLFNTITETLNVGGAATAVNIGATTGTTTIRNDAVITGNLTVNGTTTTVNSTTLTVDDKNIELGSVATPTDTTASGGGITLKGATDKTITWTAANGWESSEKLKVNGRITGTENLEITGNAQINGVYIGKNALGDNLGNRISAPRGTDLSIQSGSTMILNSDYFRIKRNTSTASTISANVISGFNGSAHKFDIGDRIQYLGTTKNGLTQNAYYYVISANFTTSACSLSLTSGGSAITLTDGTNLGLNFFSEGGYGNAYFNPQAGLYSFNRELNSGNYNLEVEGTFNATGASRIDGVLTLAAGDNTTAGLNTTGAISVGGNIYGYGNYGIFVNGSTLLLNNNTTGSPTKDAEISVARGSSTAAKILWNETTDTWDLTNDVKIAGDLQIAGGDISTGITNTWLTANRVTTNTNLSARALVLKTQSSGTPTVGFGTAIGFDAYTAADVVKSAAYISVNSTDVTTGSEDFSMGFGLMKDGAAYADKMVLTSSGDLTTTGNLQVNGNNIKRSDGATMLTFQGTDLTTFAGSIKLGGNGSGTKAIYVDFDGNGTNENVLAFSSSPSIYGTSYLAKMNTNVNLGIGVSFVFIDNMVEINTSSLTTAQNSTYAVLDYFSPTSYRSAKYIVQITNGTAHQMWEGMVIHDGTNIYLSAYGDLRTNGNLATMSVGFNATTGYPELRVTPVNATTTKFKATKTYIAV